MSAAGEAGRHHAGRIPGRHEQAAGQVDASCRQPGCQLCVGRASDDSLA